MTSKKTNPASGQAERGESTNKNTRAHITTMPTKKARILEALKQPEGLNRFEAERIGDHCLNSTISDLRNSGWVIESRPEKVPSRFTSKGVRVLRYRLIGGAHDGR